MGRRSLRRALLALTSLLLLAWGGLPLGPVFVCHGMGGVHLFRPCCPQDQSGEPAWGTRCCEPDLREGVLPAAMVEQGPPSVLLAMVRAVAWPLWPPMLVLHGPTPMPRAGAPPGLPGRLRLPILRI
ncbi:MAG: hypothetical protein RMK29_20995 [Myxococcales bacterium]|nr:hypothetical protein [Myxococcota bacterium]MDW8284191.1 hypothetical protein [Myxococcales bacterium]